MTKQTQRLYLMLVIGVLIGISLVMITRTPGSDNVQEEKVNTTPSGATSTDEVSISSDALKNQIITSALPPLPQIPNNLRVGLKVEDQAPGKTVTVNSVDVTGSQWIAIYDDKDGRPGWILGAAHVREGDKTAVVELLRPEGTVSGQTYYAAILNDDGDGEFNRLTDLPPLSPDKIIIVRFKVQ